MTELELQKARVEYKMQLEGKSILLESVANVAVSSFTKQYFSDVSEEKIKNISNDEILRNAFLSTFGNTKESSNMWIFINNIRRKSTKIDDGQPELVSIDWIRPNLLTYKMPILYCNLETGMPILVNDEDLEKEYTRIYLPNYSPQTETYHYNSHSIEKITKGAATLPFNRLQLYYFRLLLENSREDAVKRIKSLSLKEKEKICNAK